MESEYKDMKLNWEYDPISGDAENGKFVGRILINNKLLNFEHINLTIDIEDLITDFIYQHSEENPNYLLSKKFIGDGTNKAEVIRRNLYNMIVNLENNFPDMEIIDCCKPRMI